MTPRVSPFWLDPTRTLPHRNVGRHFDRYFYATDGTTVYRFRVRAERERWVQGAGRRRLGSEDAVVRAAKVDGGWEEEATYEH
jgi:hypothetical protein